MNLSHLSARDKNAVDTHPGIEFLIEYYTAFLAKTDKLDIQQCTTDELRNQAAEASALRKLLLDYIEEGYTKLTTQLQDNTNALERLQAFLEAALAKLGTATEQALFYLSPETFDFSNIQRTEFIPGDSFELHDYLQHLSKQSEQSVDITSCFDNLQEMQAWQRKTAIAMQELLNFLAWIVTYQKQQPERVPVALLRDTLLIYFGLHWLHEARQIPKAPVPLFLSRKFISALSNSEKTYFTLVSFTLYKILLETKPCDLSTLRQKFVQQASIHTDISSVFRHSSQEYLESLQLDAPPLLLETGLNGTFPLWVLTLTRNQGDFLLYTTAPWLYNIYQDIIFRKNYNYLRDLETIVIHDQLFQFDTYQTGRVSIRENRQTAIRQLALYELNTFRCLFNQQFLSKQ